MLASVPQGQAKMLLPAYILNFLGKKFLDATHWVGAVKRGAEGSYLQLPFPYALRFGHQCGAIGAVLRQVARCL